MAWTLARKTNRGDIARTEQITWAEMAMLRLLTNWDRARRMPSYGNPRGGEEDTDLCAKVKWPWPALVAVCCVECSWSVPLPTLTLETPYTPITEHTTGPLACSVSSVEKPPPVPREAPHVAKSASRSGEPVSTRVRRLEPFDSLSCAIARLSTAGADSEHRRV